MSVEELDVIEISKLISPQVELVTCAECLKYYIAPETATCGHSLCHGCWKGHRSCPTCAIPINKKSLKLNIQLQTLTEDVHNYADKFEKLFHVKFDTFIQAVLCDVVSDDPTRNVKEWLASSQNQFSGPTVNSQNSKQDLIPPVELSKSEIQIHTDSKKNSSPDKVVFKPQVQEDWDKIEILPNTEEYEKPTEHIVGPMDFENFFIDENEYSTEKPRRSLRKREPNTESKVPTRDVSVDKTSGKNSSIITENKSLKSKQTWSNVKKMRKEFSKLNKKNKSKLNFSIEMCKKAQTTAKVPKPVTLQADTEPLYNNIDENTPDIEINRHTDIMHTDKQVTDSKVNKNGNVTNCNVSNKSPRHSKNNNSISNTQNNNDEIPTKQLNNPDCEKNHLIHDNSMTHVMVEKPLPFIKKSALCHNIKENVGDNVRITQNKVDPQTVSTNSDDIEISIKIGNTITNIVIKNKKSNIQVNTDREVQTSLGSHGISNRIDAMCSPIKTLNVENIELNIEDGNNVLVNKSVSIKKNTASADTATAQFEITNSVEKELSNVMECAESNNHQIQTTKISALPIKSSKLLPSADLNHIGAVTESVEDVDIFNSGSVKEGNVQLLKDTKHAGSEILAPTLKSKKSQIIDKRNCPFDDTKLPNSKKQKVNPIENIEEPPKEPLPTDMANDSENMNYDAIMSQVFANIDAEIQNSSNNTENKTSHHNELKCNESPSVVKLSQVHSQVVHKTQNLSINKIQNTTQNNEVDNQKYSENMFSLLDKDSESHNVSGKNNKLPVPTSTQQQIDNLLTPGMCLEMAATRNTQVNEDIEMMEPVIGTPAVDNDDSDKSVVEETPQKNLSITKHKQNSDLHKNDNNSKSLTRILPRETDKSETLNNKASDSQIIRSIINISDTSEEINKTRDATIIDINKKKLTLETPLNINKFVNHITHNSTPIARKSLNFENDNLDDPEQTLCPTTTQEKEFLAKAFEQTPKSPVRKPLTVKNVGVRQNKKLYIAGSCLAPNEMKTLKLLCYNKGWKFLDKYTDELTHLVVGVDDENKSQRSVKYMCALAASKWIVTYLWVEMCFRSATAVDETPYEALDASGEPGPRRSRTTILKVFDGISFYCMPPFSVLDRDTLKLMLRAAGGRVVEQPDQVMADKNSSPGLLIAEPEHTQEDRFVFMAMEHKVVPVNYEWVLNCLGTYTLGSIIDLLLCPPTLLPPETKNWPEILLRQEDDD